MRKTANDNDKQPPYLIRGGGFHCRVVLDLRQVKSISRSAFWKGGWWYTAKLLDGTETPIHVREDIDVMGLLEQYGGGRSEERQP